MNTVGTFVNCYSDGYKVKQGSIKAQVCAHAARRKHEQIRNKRKSLVYPLNAQAAAQPKMIIANRDQLLPSPPFSPDNDSKQSIKALQTILCDGFPPSPPLTENEEVSDAASSESPERAIVDHTIKRSLFTTSTKLPHSCIDYFHLLLPPAFCGVDVPLTMLMPEARTSMSLKNFGRSPLSLIKFSLTERKKHTFTAFFIIA